MKKLLLALVLTTFAAQAIEIKIASFKAEEYSKVEAAFNINPELGRAWVEVTATENINDPEGYANDYTSRYQVSGLRFDAESKSVRFEHPGYSLNLACAVGKKAKQRSLKMTDSCRFVEKAETKIFDDGYYVQKVNYRTIYLEIK